MPLPAKIARQARRMTPPPQPSADLKKVNSRADVANLYRHAEQYGKPVGNTGFYEIDGFEPMDGVALPSKAQIGSAKTSDILRGTYGDTNYQKAVDSIMRSHAHTAFGHVPHPSDPTLARVMNPDERVAFLEEPVHTILNDTDDHYAAPYLGLISINPKRFASEEPGVGLSVVSGHELGHVANPFSGNTQDVRLFSEPIHNSADFHRRILKDLTTPGMSSEEKLKAAHKAARLEAQADHFNKVPELTANMSLARGLYHGLTGEFPVEPSDWSRMFDDMTRDRVLPVPGAMGVVGPFPEDPVMQYGPRKGQKADGWNSLRYYFQKMLQRALLEERQVLTEFGPHIAATGSASDASAV